MHNDLYKALLIQVRIDIISRLSWIFQHWRITMRLPASCLGLLSVIMVSIIGCTTATHVASSRQVSMEAAIKTNQTQQTRRRDQEGLVTAIVKDCSAIAEFTPRWNVYWIRLALLLEPGKSDGKTICELEETYRASDKGVYAVRLEGIAESCPVPVGAIESGLEISIEIHSSVNNGVIAETNKIIRPKVYNIQGQQQFWFSPADELEPLNIEMEAGTQYIVHTRLALSASTESRLINTPMSIDGEFRLILESVDKVKKREELAITLAQELIGLWVKEDSSLARNPKLHDAANSLTRLFLGECIRYVDIHVPKHIRSACFEHARIVREWYEVRMSLDPNLARWFRMTTVRRNTPFLWQSSNMVTPNVSDPPDRWMDDGTGIVLEPKPAGAGNFYGRYVTAKEFYMGIRPKIQKTAQAPSLNSK
jgi:hypothetical protein